MNEPVSDSRTSVPHVDSLWLPASSLWAAGLNARQEWEARIFPDLLQWKASWNTSDIDIEMVFPDELWDTERCITFVPSQWGLFSHVRDFLDVLVYALANRMQVAVNDCNPWPNCPFRGHFLHCMWPQAPYNGVCGGQVCFQSFRGMVNSYQSMNAQAFKVIFEQVNFTSSLFQPNKWHKMLSTERGRLFALGILRSLLVGKFFSTGSFKVEMMVRNLASRFRAASLGRTLVLHVRQTDKRSDKGWHSRQYSFPQLSHYTQAIQKLESYTGLQFTTVIFLTDEPSLESWTYNISLAFRGHVRVLFPSLFQHLGIVSSEGHERLRHRLGTAKSQLMYDAVASESLFAGRNGDFIIGCGCSGLSHFISWLIASRKGCDPFGVSAWIEDIVDGHSPLSA